MSKAHHYNINPLLPTNREEMRRLGWNQPDIILVTADAYVDHPAFGVALIGRYLEKLGYKVAILTQPDWNNIEDFRQFGPPRLFWGVTSGAIDARLNDHASLGHRRKEDLYSPGGKTGLRPTRPLLVYSAKIRQAYKAIPIILGGLEASLRRVVHYDFVEEKLKRSVLIDSKADLLVYGMAERAIKQIAERLNNGQSINQMTDIAGIVFPVRKETPIPEKFITLPSLEEQQKNNKLVIAAHKSYQAQAYPNGLPVMQEQNPSAIILTPPAEALSTEELDEIYNLPFTRSWHPKYDKAGGVPALEPVRFSITTHRGCFGGCSFCSIHLHQGKQIASRSIDNILAEASSFKNNKNFRGTISDIGGPTANMYGMKCPRADSCSRPSCISPRPCKHFKCDSTDLMNLMNSIVKWKKSQSAKVNVYVASGIRHDLAIKNKNYIDLLAKEFVGGHLKVAPEHYCPKVLELMNKPSFKVLEEFEKFFIQASQKAGKKQYLVPYFISSHPGCTDDDALTLMEYLISRSIQLRQVQDFIPLPLTISAAMYVSGIDANGKKIHIPKGHRQKKLQAALLQYYEPRNIKMITEFLLSKGRKDLIAKINAIQKYQRLKK